MGKGQPLFSVVMPVYNNLKYLRAAVDSVLAQDFEEFELIIVDDGSNDGTSELVDEIALLDSRIKVIHQENQWIYASFNNGVKKAIGEYIIFVNSDDKLRSGILKYAADRCTTYDFPDVLWSILIINKCDSQQNIIERDTRNLENYLESDLIYKNISDFHKDWLMLYSKLIVRNTVNFYKRSLLLSHPFRNDVYGADLLLNIEISKVIDSCVVLSVPSYDYYNYVENEASASGMRYYEYEHDMFSETYYEMAKMLSIWGCFDSDSEKRLRSERVDLFLKEIICIKDKTCLLGYKEKVFRCIQYRLDNLVDECIDMTNRAHEADGNTKAVIRDILLEEYIKSNGMNFELFGIINNFLEMEASNVSFLGISEYLYKSL